MQWYAQGHVLHFSEEDAYELVEQKTDDEIEPKFKVGDWILYSGDYYEGVRHITKIDENGYYIERNGLPHGIIPFNHEKCMRLWTIQDAKDGDVLVYRNSATEIIMLFKSWLMDGKVAYTHFHIFDNEYRVNSSCDCGNGAHPATKEQRDLLFQKMKEAGYEFDFEKKELKKIESIIVRDFNSVFSREQIEEIDKRIEKQQRLHNAKLKDAMRKVDDFPMTE